MFEFGLSPGGTGVGEKLTLNKTKPMHINRTAGHKLGTWFSLGTSVFTLSVVGRVEAQFPIQRNAMEVQQCSFNGYLFEGVPFGTYDFGGLAGSQKTGTASIILENDPFPLTIEHGDNGLFGFVAQLKSTSQIDLFGYGLDYYYIRSVSGLIEAHVYDDFFDIYTGVNPDLSGGTFGTTGNGSVVIEIHKGSLSGPVVGGNTAHQFVNDISGSYSAAPPGDALIIEGVNHDIPGFNPAAEFWPTNVVLKSGR